MSCVTAVTRHAGLQRGRALSCWPPGHELIDLRCRPAIDELLENHLRGRLSGSTPLRRQVSISEARQAHTSAPSSPPANKAFLRLRAMGRIARSTALVSSSIRPSSRKRISGGPDLRLGIHLDIVFFDDLPPGLDLLGEESRQGTSEPFQVVGGLGESDNSLPLSTGSATPPFDWRLPYLPGRRQRHTTCERVPRSAAFRIGKAA